MAAHAHANTSRLDPIPSDHAGILWREEILLCFVLDPRSDPFLSFRVCLLEEVLQILQLSLRRGCVSRAQGDASDGAHLPSLHPSEPEL